MELDITGKLKLVSDSVRHAKHVRNGVETLRVPTFEQNQEILQSTLATFACTPDSASPLKEAAAAQERLWRGENFGKITLNTS
jgi:hypothetical protein